MNILLICRNAAQSGNTLFEGRLTSFNHPAAQKNNDNIDENGFLWFVYGSPTYGNEDKNTSCPQVAPVNRQSGYSLS